jgi:hypothetical protein
MPEIRLRFAAGARCVVTPGERILRAVIALFVSAFALSMLGNLWCAVPAGICAVFLTIGAITGWCPGNFVTLGSSEAQQKIDV